MATLHRTIPEGPSCRLSRSSVPAEPVRYAAPVSAQVMKPLNDAYINIGCGKKRHGPKEMERKRERAVT